MYLPWRSHLFICGLFYPNSGVQATFPDTAEPVTREASNLLSWAISLLFQSALATGISSTLNYHTCHLGPDRMNGMSQIKLRNQSLQTPFEDIRNTENKTEGMDPEKKNGNFWASEAGSASLFLGSWISLGKSDPEPFSFFLGFGPLFR